MAARLPRRGRGALSRLSAWCDGIGHPCRIYPAGASARQWRARADAPGVEGGDDATAVGPSAGAANGGWIAGGGFTMSNDRTRRWGNRPPARHYRAGRELSGQRSMPQARYPATWEQRCVRSNGQIRWQGRLRFVGEAVVGCKAGPETDGCGKMVRCQSGGSHCWGSSARRRCWRPSGLRPTWACQHRPHPKKKV